MENRVLVRSASLASQVQEILIERIRQGLYPPEGQLPPENQLAAEFSVSRATVRSAIETLAARGLVVRKQGVGTFVSRLARLAHPLNQTMDFHDMIAASGFAPGHRFLRSALVPAGPQLGWALDIAVDALVLETHKAFTADGEPVIYAVNHIPAAILGDDLAQALAVDPSMTEPLFAFLEHQCGQIVEYNTATIRAEIANNCDFPGLDPDPCLPVLVMEEVGYNPGELPIWHSLDYYPGNRMNFEMVRQRGPATRVGK